MVLSILLDEWSRAGNLSASGADAQAGVRRAFRECEDRTTIERRRYLADIQAYDEAQARAYAEAQARDVQSNAPKSIMNLPQFRKAFSATARHQARRMQHFE
jgi:hypothetical protein